jgi:PAS domain S-box-containing protein
MTTLVATILIVDDETQNRKVLEALLRPEGYVTLTAASGDEALASIAKQAPDLMLIDAMMPGMDGFELTGRLKADPATASIPVIMVTALIDKASRLAGLKAGAEEFLTKPVDRAELWLRVRNLLRLKAYGDLLRNHSMILERQVQARTVDLQRLEARYRGLLEAAPDAMVVVNHAGAIVLLNVQAERQFGYPRDELLGRPMNTIIPDGFAERIIADGLRSPADASAQQIGTGIELLGRRKDGLAFPVEIMLSPLESEDGILVTAAIRDITQRKAAEAHLLQKVNELYRSNEELAQFAYVASHDLQEPLRMVAAYTQLLSKKYVGKLDASADEFIAYAVDGATRMQQLIKDLLNLSRVGTSTNSLLNISSEKSLQEALRNLRRAIEDSSALVTHDAMPDVLGDQTQLTQLFQNLIGNAIKYQSPGIPRIHVAAVRDVDNKWTFSVRDNGLGIDPQYFERIFGMFQRLHKRDEFTGTGIGLAICKKIVERHGGSISVDSTPGQGSTFRFTLASGENKAPPKAQGEAARV